MCSEILVGVLMATVRGAVGSQAILLTDSRCQNVDGLEVDDDHSLALSCVAGEDDLLMGTVQKYALTCPQIARFHPSWVTADTAS